MKLRDVMRPPSSVRVDDTLWRAERTMARRHLKHLPVIDAGQIVGVVSESDVLAFRATATAHAWWLAPVREVMHDAPPTVTPDDTPDAATDRLADSPEAILAVVERGFLVGIVTLTDVLDAELRTWASAPAVTAADVMTETPVTVTPRHSLVDAARIMSDHQIRHVPVVEDGALVGLLSDRDLLRRDPRRWEVRDVMSRSVLSVEPGTSVAEVSRILVEARIGAVPVIDDDSRLVGIVSYVDVLRSLALMYD